MAWEQEEIRVAVDGPFGADADDSERRGPEKGQDADRQDSGRTADAQPAEVRSRAEYYEVLRAQDQQMNGSDRPDMKPAPAPPGRGQRGTSKRSKTTQIVLRSIHCARHPNAPSTSSTGTTGAAGTGTGQGGQEKRNSRLGGTTTRLWGMSER